MIMNSDDRKRQAMTLLDIAYSNAEGIKKRRLSIQNGDGTVQYTGLSSEIRNVLLTYSIDKWSTKPYELRARLFASRGWKCVSRDILQCVSCKKYLSVLLPKVTDVESYVYRNIISQIISLSIEGHSETCIRRFSINDCNPSISTNDIPEDELTSSYSSLKKLDFSGTSLSFLSLIELNLSQSISEDEKVALLACTGWKNSVRDTIECIYCQRTIGLWMYREGKALNADREHQSWCIYASSEESDESTWNMRLLRAKKFASNHELSSVSNLIRRGRASCSIIGNFSKEAF